MLTHTPWAQPLVLEHYKHLLSRPPVWREAHGENCGDVQVSRLVNDALRDHAAALVDDGEEDELDDVLRAEGWRFPTLE